MSTIDVVANMIGSYSGAGNVIAYNGYCGVGVSGGAIAAGEPTNVLDIESNTFFDNGQLAIDLSSTLAGDGATANDSDGHANGPNLFQNYPVLSRVRLNTAGKLYVSGALASATTPNQDLRIEVFSNPTGQSQGTHWRGCISLRTDASGRVTFEDQGPFTLPPGDADITLTGTTDFGTSEMSAPAASTASNDIIFANGFDTVAAPGTCN